MQENAHASPAEVKKNNMRVRSIAEKTENYFKNTTHYTKMCS